MNPPIDYGALGFRLTTADVAEVLDIDPAVVLDYVRAAELTALALAEGGVDPRVTLRFHPDEVRDLQRRLRDKALTVDSRTRVRVQSVLREYLLACEPTGDYDEAVLTDRPLLARTRRRRELVHVRIEALASFQRLHAIAPILPSSLIRALEGVGAVRVRGVIPASAPGGRQRWGTWWRIPASVMDSLERGTVSDVVAGVLDGDELTRSGSGEWHTTTPLGVD